MLLLWHTPIETMSLVTRVSRDRRPPGSVQLSQTAHHLLPLPESRTGSATCRTTSTLLKRLFTTTHLQQSASHASTCTEWLTWRWPSLSNSAKKRVGTHGPRIAAQRVDYPAAMRCANMISPAAQQPRHATLSLPTSLPGLKWVTQIGRPDPTVSVFGLEACGRHQLAPQLGVAGQQGAQFRWG